MTGWIETALCGLPSDFSHETIIAATVTRSTMVDALHQAGFVDADAWVSNVKDFPRIRGDKALILLQVTRKNKTETYLADELLTWGGWNTSIGPYGFMYKGKPGETDSEPTTPSPSPLAASRPPPMIYRHPPRLRHRDPARLISRPPVRLRRRAPPPMIYRPPPRLSVFATRPY